MAAPAHADRRGHRGWAPAVDRPQATVAAADRSRRGTGPPARRSRCRAPGADHCAARDVRRPQLPPRLPGALARRRRLRRVPPPLLLLLSVGAWPALRLRPGHRRAVGRQRHPLVVRRPRGARRGRARRSPRRPARRDLGGRLLRPHPRGAGDRGPRHRRSGRGRLRRRRPGGAVPARGLGAGLAIGGGGRSLRRVRRVHQVPRARHRRPPLALALVVPGPPSARGGVRVLRRAAAIALAPWLGARPGVDRQPGLPIPAECPRRPPLRARSCQRARRLRAVARRLQFPAAARADGAGGAQLRAAARGRSDRCALAHPGAGRSGAPRPAPAPHGRAVAGSGLRRAGVGRPRPLRALPAPRHGARRGAGGLCRGSADRVVEPNRRPAFRRAADRRPRLERDRRRVGVQSRPALGRHRPPRRSASSSTAG